MNKTKLLLLSILLLLAMSFFKIELIPIVRATTTIVSDSWEDGSMSPEWEDCGDSGLGFQVVTHRVRTGSYATQSNYSIGTDCRLNTTLYPFDSSLLYLTVYCYINGSDPSTTWDDKMFNFWTGTGEGISVSYVNYTGHVRSLILYDEWSGTRAYGTHELTKDTWHKLYFVVRGEGGQCDLYFDDAFDVSMTPAHMAGKNYTEFWLDEWDNALYDTFFDDLLLQDGNADGEESEYESIVGSDPEINAAWEINSTNYNTPWTDNMTEGVKHLEATELTAIRNSGQNMYGFTHWMVTNSSGSFNITAANIYPDIQSEHNFTLFYDDRYTVGVDSTPYTSATFTATGYAFTAPKVLIRYADNHTFVCTLFEVEVNASYKYTFDHWSINGSGYYGSLSIDVEIEGDTNLTMHYIGSWIASPYIPTFAHDAINGTWYFRSDTHTIHEQLGYKLDFVNTYTSTYDSRNIAGSYNISYGIRVWIIDIFGNNYELSGGTPEAIVLRSSDGEGYQSAYFDCPAYAGLIDAVQVNLYQRFNLEPWSLRRYFITDENLYFKLPASSWTIRYYTNRTTASTTAYFFHGSTTFNSKIMFQYYKANPWELALARLQDQNYLGFMTTPWTYYLGDIFWSLALLFGIVTMYNRVGSLKPILALLWLLGGAGSVLSLMVPQLVLHIAWLMLAVAMGLTLFKLIYR